MELNYLSGKLVIADIYDEFNIKSDDWVLRTPNWIYKALRYLRHIQVYTDNYDENKFTNYKITLPEFINNIKLLLIDDKIIINNEFLNNIVSNYSYGSNKYVIRDNEILLDLESGSYKIWFKSIPIEFDDTFQIFIPKIPNRERILENIKWYVFKNILSRGYIHPIYSLGNKNTEYDPNYKWQNSLKGAKHDLSPMTLNEINRLSNIFNTFLSKPNFTFNQVNNSIEL